MKIHENPPKSSKTNENQRKSPKIIKNQWKSMKITQNHEKSPKIAENPKNLTFPIEIEKIWQKNMQKIYTGLRGKNTGLRWKSRACKVSSSLRDVHLSHACLLRPFFRESYPYLVPHLLCSWACPLLNLQAPSLAWLSSLLCRTRISFDDAFQLR